jgi:hypothetical protein
MRTEIIGVAAEVRNDEIYIGVLWRDHVDNLGAAGDIDEKWNSENSSGVANFASGHGLMTVYLDSTKGPFPDGVAHNLQNASRISSAVNECKSDQAPRMAGYDARELSVRHGIVTVKRSHHDGPVDSGRVRTAKIGFQRSMSIPRRSHLVAEAGMTMAIDDHVCRSCTLARKGRAASGA